MSKPKEKTSLSDGQLSMELIKLFESGITTKANCYELLRTRFKMMKQRFLKIHDLAHADWQKLAQTAQAKQVDANVSTVLEWALKSKMQRMQQLDQMLDPDYRHEDIVGADVKTGKVLRVKRCLSPMELKQIHSELSKMSGDYAATKLKHSGDPDSPVKVETTVSIEIIDTMIPLAGSESEIHG